MDADELIDVAAADEIPVVTIVAEAFDEQPFASVTV